MQAVMQTTVLSVLFLALMLTGEVAGDNSWTYADPSEWSTQFPDYCNGSRQSPINIDMFHTLYEKDNTLDKFTFGNYGAIPLGITVVNSAHLLSVRYDNNEAPTLSGGGLDGEYNFHSYHFHWGSDDTKGSEHTINSVSYPLELNIVHVKNGYADIDEALTHSDGVAILAILFETSTRSNKALDPMLDVLPDVENVGSTEVLPENVLYPLGELLPRQPSRYFRYAGGLSTPPCREGVIYTVFQRPSHITPQQLAEFRTLKDGQGATLQDNSRPPQPLNGRVVSRSFPM